MSVAAFTASAKGQIVPTLNPPQRTFTKFGDETAKTYYPGIEGIRDTIKTLKDSSPTTEDDLILIHSQLGTMLYEYDYLSSESEREEKETEIKKFVVSSFPIKEDYKDVFQNFVSQIPFHQLRRYSYQILDTFRQNLKYVLPSYQTSDEQDLITESAFRMLDINDREIVNQLHSAYNRAVADEGETSDGGDDKQVYSTGNTFGTDILLMFILFSMSYSMYKKVRPMENVNMPPSIAAIPQRPINTAVIQRFVINNFEKKALQRRELNYRAWQKTVIDRRNNRQPIEEYRVEIPEDRWDTKEVIATKTIENIIALASGDPTAALASPTIYKMFSDLGQLSQVAVAAAGEAVGYAVLRGDPPDTWMELAIQKAKIFEEAVASIGRRKTDSYLFFMDKWQTLPPVQRPISTMYYMDSLKYLLDEEAVKNLFYSRQLDLCSDVIFSEAIRLVNNTQLQRFVSSGKFEIDPKEAYDNSADTLLFHGTESTSVSPISTSGLLIQGDFAGRNGAMLGRAIYGAPNPCKSKHYVNAHQRNPINVDDLFMLVCLFNLTGSRRAGPDTSALNSVYDEYAIFDQNKCLVLWIIKVLPYNIGSTSGIEAAQNAVPGLKRVSTLGGLFNKADAVKM